MRRRERNHDLDRPAAPQRARPGRDLQALAGNAAVTALIAARSQSAPGSTRAPGRPLELGVRQEMERRLGANLGEVRVHLDDAATAAVGAHAFAVGNRIVFSREMYKPHDAAGRRMLAHELAHVLQQRSGPVTAPHRTADADVSDPADAAERDADRIATRAATTPPPSIHARRSARTT